MSVSPARSPIVSVNAISSGDRCIPLLAKRLALRAFMQTASQQFPNVRTVLTLSANMSATCEVIARGTKLYVFANCEVQAGVRMACRPVTVLEQSSDVEAVGRAVTDALRSFRTNVPFPDDYNKAANEALTDTGFKNWRSFSKGAQRLGVQSVGTEILVTPTVADARGGYADLNDKSIKVGIDPASVGRTVLDALHLCEFKSRLD
jgi:hypothetical protein